MRGRPILLAAVALVLPAAALAAAHDRGKPEDSGKKEFHIAMTGAAETPAGDPDGRGTAEIKIAGSQVCWQFKLSRIAAPSAAHIHRGAAGAAGPIVVPLGGAYKSKGCIAAPSAAIARQIAARPSAYYVNVHNAKYPGGALRGQLAGSRTPAPAPAASGGTTTTPASTIPAMTTEDPSGDGYGAGY